MKLSNKNVLSWLFDRKDGYKLENAIFTTFTLTSSVIYDLLLHMISPALTEESDSAKRIALASYGPKAAEKLTVFSDDNIFCDPHIPRALNKALAQFFIPHTVCRIKLDNGGFFHPKLMIAHYTKENHPDYIRFAVLSKNLTHKDTINMICAQAFEIPNSGASMRAMKNTAQSRTIRPAKFC